MPMWTEVPNSYWEEVVLPSLTLATFLERAMLIGIPWFEDASRVLHAERPIPSRFCHEHNHGKVKLTRERAHCRVSCAASHCTYIYDPVELPRHPKYIGALRQYVLDHAPYIGDAVRHPDALKLTVPKSLLLPCGCPTARSIGIIGGIAVPGAADIEVSLNGRCAHIGYGGKRFGECDGTLTWFERRTPGRIENFTPLP